MAELLSFAEKRRQKRFLEERALRELEKSGVSVEDVDAFRGLFKKGLIETIQMESGEFMFRPTQEGKDFIKNLDLED